MALAFGLSVRSELSKSTASAIRQAIFVIPYLVAVIALLRPPDKWAYYLCSALLFAFPVFIVLADIALLLKVGTSSRSEEGRVGKECGGPGRARWSPFP